MKIIIIGNGGSGKSTLGNKLSIDLGIPVTHLDKLSWKKDFQNFSEDDFTIALFKEMSKPDWIIEGWAYHSTVYERLKRADVIIYLKYPFEFCMNEAVKRNREYHNKSYPFDPFEGDRNSKEDLLRTAIIRVHEKLEPELQIWLKEFKEDYKKKIFTYTSREDLNRGYFELLKTLRDISIV